MFGNGRDEQDILILQLDVSLRTLHDALQIDGDDLLGAVGLQTTQYGTVGHSLRRQPLSTLQQTLHTVHLVAQLVHARTSHSAIDLHHILVEVINSLYADRVAITEFERREVELINIEDVLHLFRIAVDANGLLMCIAGETTTIF